MFGTDTWYNDVLLILNIIPVFTQIANTWNIVKTFHKGKTHAHCTHTNKLDKLETQGQMEFTQVGKYVVICITYWSDLYSLLHWYWTDNETGHGLTAGTAESWCHHLPTYCVDRGLADGAPAGNEKEQKIT